MIWEAQHGGSSSNGGGFRGSALFLSAPSAPTVTPSGSGGTVANGTYFCVITYSGSGAGDSKISGQTSTGALTGGASSFTVTAPSDPGTGGTITWNLYVATVSGGPYFPQGTALALGSNRVVTTTPPTSGTQPAGTDYSQQTGQQVNIDNSTITATTAGANSNVITFTGYTPTGADVGNIVNMTGGTNITIGRYEITAITSTTWTVTGAANLTTASGAGSALLGKMGGCADHPATITGPLVAGNIIFVKYNATAYSCGSSSNVSGGKIAPGVTSFWQGYDVTRQIGNTDANWPILDASAASIIIFATGSFSGLQIRNFKFTNSGANATVSGISIDGSSGLVQYCGFDAMSSNAVTSTNTGSLITDCYATNRTGANPSFNTTGTAVLRRCYVGPAASGAGDGFKVQAGGIEDCIANGAGGIGFNIGTGTFVWLRNSLAYNCASHGVSAGGRSLVEWCIAYGCGTSGTVYGFTTNSATSVQVVNCAGGGNRTANTDPAIPVSSIVNFQSLTSDPTVNAGAGNLGLNNTGGAGAVCRGVSVAFPSITSTVSYRDIGAVQHSDTSATNVQIQASRVFTGF